jgi:hypothetical protein
VEQSQAMIYLDDGVSRQASLEDAYSIISLHASYVTDKATIEFSRSGLGFEGEPELKQVVVEIPRVYVVPTMVYYNYVQVPMTDNMEVYDALDEVALFVPGESTLLVKIQWDSGSGAILEINDLEIETNFSVREDSNDRPEISVFPNPVSPESQVHVELLKPGQYYFTLLNRLGQAVGQNTVPVDFPGYKVYGFHELFPCDLSSGIYILKIAGSSGILSSVNLVVLD